MLFPAVVIDVTGASTLTLLAVGIALAGLGGVILSAGSRRRRA